MIKTKNGRIVLSDTTWQEPVQALAPYQPQVITIPAAVPNYAPLPQWEPVQPRPRRAPGHQDLGELIRAGWHQHGRAKGAWVEGVQHGCYSYEAYTEWRVCAVAAAYLAAYPNESPESIRYLDDHKAAIGLTLVLGYNMKDVKILSIRREAYGQIRWLDGELVAMNDEGWPSHMIIEYATASGQRWLNGG